MDIDQIIKDIRQGRGYKNGIIDVIYDGMRDLFYVQTVFTRKFKTVDEKELRWRLEEIPSK